MRAIVRFSVDNEKNSALRNKLAGVLTAAGFVRNQNTATYEHQHIDASGLSGVHASFWTKAAAHRGTGRVDHFWMYSDRTDLDDII